MATEAQKATNKRLTQEALDRKFAKDTNQSPNKKEFTAQQGTTEAAKSFGGLTGDAAKALLGRKQKIDDALKDAD